MRTIFGFFLTLVLLCSFGCGCRKNREDHNILQNKKHEPSECEHADDGGIHPGETEAQAKERWNQSWSPEADTYKPKKKKNTGWTDKQREEDAELDAVGCGCDEPQGDKYDKKAHQRKKHEGVVHDEADKTGGIAEQKAEVPQGQGVPAKEEKKAEPENDADKKTKMKYIPIYEN